MPASGCHRQSHTGRLLAPRVMAWVLVLAVLPLGLTGLLDEGMNMEAEGAVTQPRKVDLLELFTAVWCPPCKNADLAVEELYRAHGNDLAIIAYHPGFWTETGSPDPTSKTYWTDNDPFGVNGSKEQLALYEPVEDDRGYPTVVINGNADTQIISSDSKSVKHTAEVYQQQLDKEASTSAYRLEGGAPVITNSTFSFNLTVSSVTNSTGDVRLHVVIIEDNLYWYGWDGMGQGSNGIDLHRFVARWIMEPLPLANVTAGHEFEVPIEPWWDPDQLGYVLFLQDNDTLEVAQALAHYPNPVTPSSDSSTPQPSLVMVMAVVCLVSLMRGRVRRSGHIQRGER